MPVMVRNTHFAAFTAWKRLIERVSDADTATTGVAPATKRWRLLPLDQSTATPYPALWHAVIETPGYIADAKREGMTSDEMTAAVDRIASNPRTGDLIVGSGGCRKARIAGKGKSKSGGYRIVTFFGGEDVPIFLLAALSKGSRANFSAAERNAMKQAAKRLRESLSTRVGSKGRAR